MAAISTRATRIAKKMVRPEYDAVPSWAHPDVLYWYDDWMLIRDCVAGEKDIKERAQVYLPKLEGMDGDAEYLAYLDRGTFYNFTGRTVMALTGTLFRRAPFIKNLPDSLADRMKAVSDESAPFRTYAQQIGTEILTLGRVGVLLDLPEGATTTPEPYFTTYTAENIVDWEEEKDPKTGRKRLVKVVLREFKLINDTTNAQLPVQRWAARYRVLSLEGGVYTVTTYTNEKGDADLVDGDRDEAVTPTRRGVKLNFIPFVMFGVQYTSSAVEKSPSLDIARLNISHYRSYTHLEHGRFFVGLPIYYAEKISEEGGDYVLGPSRVWELDKGASAGIIECNGQGLKFLENALASKEAQAASLGGRMIGVTAMSTAETDNQTKLKERNEQAILLCIALGLDAGFTTLMRWFVWWCNESQEVANEVEVEFNKDFLFDSTGAREFRAIQSMYEAGILPIEVVYDAMRKAEVIPDFMTQEEFKTLLNSKSSFPNNPDFDARKEGYPDAMSKVTSENQQAQRDADADNLDTELEADKEAAKEAAKAAKETAKAAAKAAPKPGAQPAKPAVKKPAI